MQYETRLLRREEHYGAILFQLPPHHNNLTTYFTIALFTPSPSLNLRRLKLFTLVLKAQYFQVRDVISHCVHHYEFYRVSEEEMSIFWEIILSVILSKIVRVHISYSERFSIYSYYTMQEFGFGTEYCPSFPPYCVQLDFCLWGWI